jgi:hypothetical protein
LITKIVQCCANNVEFGVKEPYMAPFNKLVKNCQKRMVKFFEQCSALSFDANGSVVFPAEETPGAAGSGEPGMAASTSSVPSEAPQVAPAASEEFDEVELEWSFHTVHTYLHKNFKLLESSAASAKPEFQIRMSQEDMDNAATTVRKLKALLDTIGPPTDIA